jgi:hypothetical protein
VECRGPCRSRTALTSVADFFCVAACAQAADAVPRGAEADSGEAEAVGVTAVGAAGEGAAGAGAVAAVGAVVAGAAGVGALAADAGEHAEAGEEEGPRS